MSTHGDAKKYADVAAVNERLALLSKCWDVWYSASRDRDWPTKGVGKWEIVAVKALTLQLWRQARMLAVVCSRGDAMVGDVIARSIFESALAIRFILHPDFRLCIAFKTDQNGQKTRSNKDGRVNYTVSFMTKGARPRRARKLSHEFRARLFLGFLETQDEHYVSSKIGIPELAMHVRTMRRSIREAKKYVRSLNMSGFAESLPASWRRVFQRTQSYCGLTVAELASQFGAEMVKWYHTIYHFQSRSAHSTSTLGHVLRIESGRPMANDSSLPDAVLRTLESGMSMLVDTLRIVARRYGFKESAVRQVNDVLHEYECMISE